MFFKDKRRRIQDLLGHTKVHLELGQVVHAPFHQQSHIVIHHFILLWKEMSISLWKMSMGLSIVLEGRGMVIFGDELQKKNVQVSQISKIQFK